MAAKTDHCGFRAHTVAYKQSGPYAYSYFIKAAASLLRMTLDASLILILQFSLSILYDMIALGIYLSPDRQTRDNRLSVLFCLQHKCVGKFGHKQEDSQRMAQFHKNNH